MSLPLRRALLAAALLFACGRSSPDVTPTRASVIPEPARRIAPPPGAAARRSLIVVERHDRTRPTAVYLPIDVGESSATAARPLESGEHPAMRDPVNRIFFARAAFSAGLFVRAESSGPDDARRFQLVATRTGSAGGTPITVDLEALEPTALHVVRNVVYVGSNGRVDYVDLDEQPRSLHTIRTRTGRFIKPYDLFVRDGDHLLAIDDQVTPRFADWLRLDARGHPTPIADFELPEMINGIYAAADLVPEGPDAWTLYAVLPFGIITGPGQTLATIHIRGTRVEPDHTVVLNQTGPPPGVLEEFTPRGTRGTLRLTAGTTMTRWHAVAVTPDRANVLVAAAERGLLSFPAVFDSATRATVIDVGGSCLDVMRMDRRLFALVRTANGDALVELVALGATLSAVVRASLPGPFNRFVR